MNPDIVVVGSLNLDLVVQVARFPLPGETIAGQSLVRYCGGKGANQAFAAGKLGARVAMLGQVGNDDAGTLQIANLRDAGVNTDHVLRSTGSPTGTAIIELQAGGENRIIVVAGANGDFTPDKLTAGFFSRGQVALFQLEVPLPTVARGLEQAHAAGALTILDPAPAPAALLPEPMLQQTDYLTPNLSELGALSSINLNPHSDIETILGAARKLCQHGTKTVLAKLGSRGVLIVTTDTVLHLPAFNVTPADSTAAGDCFNAAFAVALVEGKDVKSAATFANAAAAISVTRMGAQASMPARSEVESLLQSQRITL